MEIERLPHLALANGLAKVVEEITELEGKEKRLILSEFTEMLRPVCKAAEDGFTSGFDEGYIAGSLHNLDRTQLEIKSLEELK